MGDAGAACSLSTSKLWCTIACSPFYATCTACVAKHGDALHRRRTKAVHKGETTAGGSSGSRSETLIASQSCARTC